MAPHGTFTYRFTPQQSGTYFYHAHGALQLQDGITGPLIVNAKEDFYRDTGAYTEELLAFLQGWSHLQGMKKNIFYSKTKSLSNKRG
mgnify:FL=1